MHHQLQVVQEQALAEAERLYQEGLSALYQSQFRYAQSVLETSLRMYQQSARQGETARTLRTLAIVMANQQDHEAARRHFEQSLILRRAQGSTQGVGNLLMDLGILEQQHGDLQEAKRYFEESLPHQEAADNRKHVAYLHLFIGRLALRFGDRQDALRHFQQSLGECDALQDRECGADVLRGFALLALSAGDMERALGLAAVADSIVLLTDDHPHFAAIEDLKATLRSEFGNVEYARRYAAGYAMAWERALAEAASLR